MGRVSALLIGLLTRDIFGQLSTGTPCSRAQEPPARLISCLHHDEAQHYGFGGGKNQDR